MLHAIFLILLFVFSGFAQTQSIDVAVACIVFTQRQRTTKEEKEQVVEQRIERGVFVFFVVINGCSSATGRDA